ncbi:hypothetical protein [Streptomyces sp. SM14]|uniref:hypothetical protein n=1 Tax=Streptomyces sp. SM14 TaxID=1736045 RepID=UPI0011AFDF02|nr:hypothetical protein [Streptomyces sp. SM14]
MTGGGDDAGRVLRYVGGPWDGAEVGWSEEDGEAAGAYVIVDGWGEERAVYEPVPGEDPLVWHYRGPIVA